MLWSHSVSADSHRDHYSSASPKYIASLKYITSPKYIASLIYIASLKYTARLIFPKSTLRHSCKKSNRKANKQNSSTFQTITGVTEGVFVTESDELIVGVVVVPGVGNESLPKIGLWNSPVAHDGRWCQPNSIVVDTALPGVFVIMRS